MNNLSEILENHEIHPIGYHKKKNVYIIDTKEQRYVIKLNTSNYDIYKYLISRGFPYFPENFNYQTDNYDLCLYLESDRENIDQKLMDYVELMALLHKKTSYKRAIDLDEIKKIYEQKKEEIENCKSFYLKMNDEIDQELFLSPSMYLLVRNISLIYYLLNNCMKSLNDWYNQIKDEKTIRISLLHNNTDLDHLIICDNKYFISWDKASFDFPVYELVDFLKKYYKLVNFKDVLFVYNKINPLSDLEKTFLMLNLLLPKKIALSSNTYQDVINLNNEITFLKKGYEIISKDKKA